MAEPREGPEPRTGLPEPSADIRAAGRATAPPPASEIRGRSPVNTPDRVLGQPSLFPLGFVAKRSEPVRHQPRPGLLWVAAPKWSGSPHRSRNDNQNQA